MRALLSLQQIYPRRALTAEEWRSAQMLSLLADSTKIMSPAQIDTVSLSVSVSQSLSLISIFYHFHILHFSFPHFRLSFSLSLYILCLSLFLYFSYSHFIRVTFPVILSHLSHPLFVSQSLPHFLSLFPTLFLSIPSLYMCIPISLFLSLTHTLALPLSLHLPPYPFSFPPEYFYIILWYNSQSTNHHINNQVHVSMILCFRCSVNTCPLTRWSVGSAVSTRLLQLV